MTKLNTKLINNLLHNNFNLYNINNSDGGVTSPTRRDIKPLYQYLYNGKYK